MTNTQNHSKKKQVSIDEHMMTLDQVCERYSTSVNLKRPSESMGLDQAISTERLNQDGPNVLTPPKKIPPILIFLHCLGNLFNVLLIIASILTYILYAYDPADNQANTYLGAILVGVAFMNAFIEFFQLQKSASILESFMNMIPQQCKSISGGKLNQIPAANLVNGEIVFIKIGDKVPADLRIFGATDLKVDNSSLTGESDPQERIPENDHNNPLEATNLVFNGTLVVNGEGYGIVVRTGDSTVLGQIANMTSGEKKAKSPLTVEINNFVIIIASIAFLTALIFFIVSLVLYSKLSIALNTAIGIFVSWVPEGLPATISILLTLSAKKMASQNVLVKDLKGVETLGAITMLATDKTGTLTKNQMTVTSMWSSLKMYTSLRNLGAEGNPDSLESPGIIEIMMNSCLNSKAKFDRTDIPMDQREIIGDATETGLVRFTTQNLKDFDNIQLEYSKVFEIPFNSENKWAMSINKNPSTNKFTVYVKGAPERVLKLCSSILVQNEALELTDDHKDEFVKAYENMASKGHRVIAFAQLELPQDQYNSEYVFDKKTMNFPTSGLTFVGLVSLEDPPKHGVREAIGVCRTAGIRVMMVTGDHPLTAEAIGRKINLMVSDTKELVAKKTGRPLESITEDEYNAIVIHGEMIDSLKDDDWDAIFSKEEIIFARTSPKHKLEIVKRAQSMGHIVGVTGDGVNDSPALKRADLGIAMNETGSDVSKEAASMILLDDNFASIVKGIEQGRLIFMNLKKSIQYTVTHSVPEVFPQILYILVPIPLPISPILILVIDLFFELAFSLSYAFDAPESREGLMRMLPRKPVTTESIKRFRRNQSQKLQPKIDQESGELVEPTKTQSIIHNLKFFFSSKYWSQKFEKTEDEIVVDGSLLSWGYLEFGVMETVFSMLAYFLVLYKHRIDPKTAKYLQQKEYFDASNTETAVYNSLSFSPSQRKEALAQAQSIYYLSVLILQTFNLFACKSKLRLPFGKHVINYKTLICILIGYSLAVFVVYIPAPINTVFGSSYRTDPLYWLIPIAGGILMLIYTCIRFYILNKRNPVKFNPAISGLQMHPTVRTQISEKQT